MFFNKIGRFNGVNKYDFGEYLTLVEGNVYEAECVRAKYEQSLRKKNLRILLARLKVLMFLFSFCFCPLILMYLAINNKSESIPLFLELIAYAIWLSIGIYFLKRSLPSIYNNIRVIKESQNNMTRTMVGVFEYAKAVSSAFFTKSGEIKSDYFQGLNQGQIESISHTLNELEFDLSVFQDLTHKSKECNEQPILVDEEIFTNRRGFSEQYLHDYFNKNIAKYNKILK